MNQNTRYLRWLLLALLLACSPAAYSMETIDWDDLVPALDNPRSPYLDLPGHVKRDFLNLWAVYGRKVRGRRGEHLDSLESKSIAALEAAGVDALGVLRDMIEFVRQQRENESRLVEELNGKNVELAGYLLPIEFSGSRIVEFLLVPTDGACIHTPVPPLNQLVHVRLQDGMENPGLFKPVRVAGRLSTDRSVQSVSYADGNSEIEVGYSMAAAGIEFDAN
jgi:hypothetical protein